EAGIGKSRLVAEFRERIGDIPHTWLESAGEQFFQNSPFHALTEMISRWLQLQTLGGAQRSRDTSRAKQSKQTSLPPGERSEPSEGVRDARSEQGAHKHEESATCAAEEEKFEWLERALSSAGLKPDEAVPLIAELLQLPVGDRYPGLTMVPE